MADTYAFCSVLFRSLFKEGPEAVGTMTKRTDSFSASRWIFFIFDEKHELLAFIDGVAGLKARLAATSQGGHEPPASTATLAVLNSTPGDGSVAADVSVV